MVLKSDSVEEKDKEEPKKRPNRILVICIVALIGWGVYARYFSPLQSHWLSYREVVQRVELIERAISKGRFSKSGKLIATSGPLVKWCWQTKGWFEAGYIAGPEANGPSWKGDKYCWALTDWYMAVQRNERITTY
tara:strand:+ start:1076 stop:1480 length:405 start_codon:yes stop_codon:yes gene_type:complete